MCKKISHHNILPPVIEISHDIYDTIRLSFTGQSVLLRASFTLKVQSTVGELHRTLICSDITTFSFRRNSSRSGKLSLLQIVPLQHEVWNE